MRSRQDTERAGIAPELGVSYDLSCVASNAAPLLVPTGTVDPLLQHLPMGWARFDRQHRVLAVNPKLAQLYPPIAQPEAVGCPLPKVWPHMAATLDPLIDGVFETSQPLPDIEARATGPEGATRHYRVSLYPVHCPDGTIGSVAALIDDITRTRHAEEALQQSEAQFRSMFELSGLGKAQCDARTGRFLRVNSRFCQILGYSEAELIGRSFTSITHPDDRERGLAAFDQLVRGSLAEYQTEKRYIRKDGTPVWVSLNVRMIYDDHNRPLSAIASIQDITARKATEEALRASERRFASLIDAMPQIVWLATPHGAPIAANPRWQAYFGRPFEEAGMLVWQQTVHADDYAEVSARWQEALTSGQPLTLECRMRRHDGAYRWFLVRGEPIRETSDAITLWCGTLTDIHDHRAAQQAAEHGQRLFRSIAEATPDILFIHDLEERRNVYTNRELTTCLGWSPQDFSNFRDKTLFDLIHPEEREASKIFYSGFAHAADGEVRQTERRVQHRDGSWRWLNIRATVFTRSPDGRPRQILGLATDITERKRNEEILRRTTEHNEQNLAQLRSIVQSMTEGLMICDRQLQLTLNPAARQMLGADDTTDTPIPLGELIASLDIRDLDDRPLAVDQWPIAKALRGETFGNYEVKVRHLTWDEPRIFSYSGAPVRNPANEIILGMVTMRDITERKAAEDELRHAKQQAEEASRAKDHFLATLSHELRTPLTPVLMIAQALEQDPTLPDHLRGDVEIIRRNVEMEARLIDDLLDLTRIVRQKLELHREAVDLHAIAAQAMSICRESIKGVKPLDFRVELDAASHMVWADAPRMQQVFWNLVSNAMKFTPAGGRIIMRSRNSAPDRVLIEIIDSGTGIEPELLDSIFNAFEQGDMRVTRRFGGLGLGLAICKALVDLHGGWISAYSEGLGKGATFSVEMPVIGEPSDELVHEMTQAPDGRDRRHRLRVLLVEDHATTARVLRRLLEAEQFQIQTADCVASALRIVERHTFDLIVSDVGLPDGTGLDLMRAIRQQNPDIRGIAVSGFGMEEDVKRSLEAGFARHLVKPVSFRMLRDTINEVMASSPAAGMASPSAQG